MLSVAGKKFIKTKFYPKPPTKTAGKTLWIALGSVFFAQPP